MPEPRGAFEPPGVSRLPGAAGPGMASRVRVVIVDDHQMFRSGVRAELGRAVEVVGEAGDVDTALRVIAETHPDVVLLDVHLARGAGEAGEGRWAGSGGS